jgi:hypothetical protein
VGQRSPAIWFFPGELKFHVRIGDTSDGNWGMNTDSIPLNQESSFRLECKGNSVTVTVNERVYKATQPSARPSGNAIVYATSPWHSAANAYLENLCYTGGGSPVTSSPNYACVKGWDSAHNDIQCWGSGKTPEELESMCNNDPRCKSYNTFGSSGGCLKHATNITNGNGGVTLCVKNT